MFIKDIDPKLLMMLTSEQLKVVERWDREARERSKLIPAICAAYNSGNKEEASKLNKRMLATDDEYCEHGRHKYSAHCAGCDEIEQILFPECSKDE
jgi:hypothetical protein